MNPVLKIKGGAAVSAVGAAVTIVTDYPTFFYSAALSIGALVFSIYTFWREI